MIMIALALFLNIVLHNLQVVADGEALWWGQMTGFKSSSAPFWIDEVCNPLPKSEQHTSPGSPKFLLILWTELKGVTLRDLLYVHQEGRCPCCLHTKDFPSLTKALAHWPGIPPNVLQPGFVWCFFSQLNWGYVFLDRTLSRWRSTFVVKSCPYDIRRRAGGEGGNRGWDGRMASSTQWTWVWANPRRWWRTGKPGMLQSMGLQRVGHNWATEQCLHIHMIALMM